MKFLNVGMSMMTGTLGKLLGGQLLKDVQTFVSAMDTTFGAPVLEAMVVVAAEVSR